MKKKNKHSQIRVLIETLNEVKKAIKNDGLMTIIRFYDEAAKEKLKTYKK